MSTNENSPLTVLMTDKVEEVRLVAELQDLWP